MTNYKHTTVGELIEALKLYPEYLTFVEQSGSTILDRINIVPVGTDGKYVHIVISDTGKAKYDDK